MRLKTLAYLILMIIVLSQPASAFQYAYQGLYQWAVKMVPTLFPFMMISSIMVYSGADIELGRMLSRFLKYIYHYSEHGLYAIFIGFLCGFPMGAKVVSELYENGKICKEEAQSLLGFCNNIGPAYFLGIILPILSQCGYHNKLPFLFGMYGIPAVYGIFLSRLYGIHTNKKNANDKNISAKTPPILADAAPNKPQSLPFISMPSISSIPSISMPFILKKSCFDNTQSLILLGGYITFTNSFRILLDFMPVTPNIKAAASSFIEIIGGVQSIYTTTLTNSVKVFWIMTALCFGGASCFLQTSCFLETSKLSLLQYLKHKLAITAISAAYYTLIIF